MIMVSCHIFSRSDFRLVYSTNSELDFVCTVQYTSIVHAMKIVGQFLVRYGPGRGGCVTKDEFSEFGASLIRNAPCNNWKPRTRIAIT